MGDFDSAIRWNEEALQIDREIGDKLGESFQLNSMAGTSIVNGETSKRRCPCTLKAW